MKIDEDIIYYHTESVRNAIVMYSRSHLSPEDLKNILQIFKNPKYIISMMKSDQSSRDDDFYLDNDDRLAKFDY